jgi:flagellar hook assembly protein FlgD
MFKKLIPIVVLTTMIATLVPMTAFAATPVITVSASTTTDPTPALTGTIDDNTATIVVNVVSAAGAVSYSSAGIADAITISGSTWTLANDKITPALAIGSYTIVATATTTGGVGTGFGILTITSSTTPITISSFTVTPTTGFDPSPNGQNEELRIAYSIEETGVSVDVLINNAAGTEVESFNSTAQSSTFTWNGEYLGSIVEPGTYKVVLKAEKTGFITATQEKSVVVSYDDADKPTIADLVVSPTSFNPDDENSVIEFTNNEAAYLTVEIRDTAGKKIRGWSNYENDSFTADNTHSITWNGLDDSSDPVSTGTYKVVVVARNSFGATLQQENVIATSSSNDEPTSNSHISGINFDPSSKFEPAVDDELLIEYDVLATTLDSLKIEAVRGSTSVELFNETNVDKENNLEVTWDGNDDNGDYVAAGTWKIMFTSKVGLTTLVAADTIEVTYAKPDVNDIYVSKDKIDNDLGEFMYVMFRVDEDALVDVNILESGDQDDTLTEDMEVIKNRWYAVQFDGGSYDYDSDLDLEVVAKNKANEDIYTTKKIVNIG